MNKLITYKELQSVALKSQLDEETINNFIAAFNNAAIKAKESGRHEVSINMTKKKDKYKNLLHFKSDITENIIEKYLVPADYTDRYIVDKTLDTSNYYTLNIIVSI